MFPLPINILFTFLFFTSTLFAQVQVNSDLLYLKDGSFLKGTAIETSTTLLQWQLTNGDVVPFAISHVDRIEVAKENLLVFSNGKTMKKSGSYHLLYSGILTSKGEEWEGNRIGKNWFHFITGVKINQFVALGIGTGLDSYNHEFVPIYLDFRGDILTKLISPYYALNVGYAFSFNMEKDNPWNNRDYKGGLMVHPAIGVRFLVARNLGLLAEVGYKYQYAKVEYDNWEYVDKINYRRLTFRVGLSF